jgi:hypothetical protein
MGLENFGVGNKKLKGYGCLSNGVDNPSNHSFNTPYMEDKQRDICYSTAKLSVNSKTARRAIQFCSY